ncbi:hypothetical protein [Myxacorys almedinensis]|nr:hypothetical protein [Myxacorys almedinensis]
MIADGGDWIKKGTVAVELESSDRKNPIARSQDPRPADEVPQS